MTGVIFPGFFELSGFKAHACPALFKAFFYSLETFFNLKLWFQYLN